MSFHAGEQMSGENSLPSVPNCIFCNQPADSEEDAFPKWLIRWLDERYPGPQESSDSREPPLVERVIGLGGEPEVRFGTLKIAIKCVCEPCNNRWMSVIQNNHAKPVLTRLLEQRSVTLSLQECRSLALWGVMTSMVLDALNDPKHWRFTDLERCLFWKKRLIPDNTQIWIGKWNDPTGPSFVGHLLARDGTPHKAVVNTIGLGTLIFQIVKINANVSPLTRTGSWHHSLLQIYPLQGNPIAYPPPAEIEGYSGMEDLELRFSPPGTDSGKPNDQAFKTAIDRWRSSHRRLGPDPQA
jgi:hypothetical protein